MKWIDLETKGGLHIASEGRDEDDLVNLVNPQPVKTHRKSQRQHLKPIIKVALDPHPAHKLYPSKDYPHYTYRPIAKTSPVT